MILAVRGGLVNGIWLICHPKALNSEQLGVSCEQLECIHIAGVALGSVRG